MSSPKVSVIVPNFNGERFVGAALDSLLREQQPALEIVVVDDGSTDNSVAIVKALAEQDPRIALLVGEHRGVSAARNAGVRTATADYITFLDSDDICLPGRIARQLRKLESSPDFCAVAGETLWFEALTPDFQPAAGSRYIKTHSATLHSALFRRALFETFGLFDEELAFCEDVDFFLRVLDGGARVHVEHEVASLYRRHPTNMTRDSHGFRRAMLAMFQRSIARRRNAGGATPGGYFFVRPFKVEVAGLLNTDRVSTPETDHTPNGATFPNDF